MCDRKPEIKHDHDSFPSTSDQNLYKCYSEENWLSMNSQTRRHSVSNTNARQKCCTESCTALRRTESKQSLLKRALSTQFLSSLWEPKLDKDLYRRIELRYKDTAKYVIWPECPLPKTFIAVEKMNKNSNSRWITHKHPGNHNLTVSTNVYWSSRDEKSSLKQQHDTSRRSERISNDAEAVQPFLPEKIVMETTKDNKKNYMKKSNEGLILERRLINNTRRSESGDDDESIMEITTSEQQFELRAL